MKNEKNYEKFNLININEMINLMFCKEVSSFISFSTDDLF